MTKKQNLIVGKLGEEIACKYLINKGYKILKRNYSTNFAELDIIAYYKSTIVIVEVKTRKFNENILARQAVDFRKRNKIILLTKYFIDEYELYDYNVRFDIIECYYDSQTINHIENAFEV